MVAGPFEDVDVAVIGAGFAGLCAARRLTQAGLDVVVLEASQRVGGRVDRLDLGDGSWLDLGGTWCGPGQDRVVALADEVGVPRFSQHAKGRNLIEFDGRVRSYPGTIPRIGMGALLDVARMQLGVSRAARRVNAETPWKARDAKHLDGITLEDWLGSRGHGRKARTLLAIGGKTLWGAEPRELSMLYVLGYVAGAGGLDPLLDTEGGAQQDRFAGGSLEIALRVAEDLGDRVVLGAAVTTVEDSGASVLVRHGKGTVRARRVVVALPPPLCGGIAFPAGLPAERTAVHGSWRMGALTKCFAVFDEPFWRQQGRTGEALSDTGPATIVFDVSPPDGATGILVGFVGGDDARAHAMAGETERRQQVLAGFGRLFGEQALRPERWVEQQWSGQPYSRGGPVAIAPPGAITEGQEAIRRPVGRIHWAGSETAGRWAGYIDGAVRSGERVAAEILAAT